MSRRTGRKQAFQILYQSDVTGSTTAEAVRRWREYRGEIDPYAVTLCYGVSKQSETIDSVISEVAVGWPLKRMNAVDRTVLRIGVFEMMNTEDVPPPVAITEAMELTRGFSSDEAPTFVGGVLRGAENYLKENGTENGTDADKDEPGEPSDETIPEERRVEHG